MKKLTHQQIEDRIAVWEDILAHMDMDMYETKGEEQQGLIIKKQLIKMRDAFLKNLKKGTV